MTENVMQSLTQWFRTEPRKARLPIAAAMMSALAWSGIPQAQAALVFNSGASSIVYQHDLDNSVAGIDRTSGNLLPALPGFPGLLFTNTAASGALNSTARAGTGFTTNPIQATTVFQPGTLLNQSDLNNVTTGSSVLTINFNLVWNNTSTLFGPPILTQFNLPVMASVGVGGEASVAVNVNWSSAQKGTLGTFAQTQVFNTPGVTLATIFGSGVVVPPSSPLLPGDALTISGTVTFTAKNADEPTGIGIDPINSAFHINTFDNDGEVDSENDPTTSHDASPLRGTDNGTYINLSEGSVPQLTLDSISGLAVDFDGFQNLIYTPAVSDFNHDFSISLFFKTDFVPDGEYESLHTLLALGSLDGNNSISLTINPDGQVLFNVISTSGEFFAFADTYNLEEFYAGDDEWHHLLATSMYDQDLGQTILSLYIDGQLAGSNNFFGMFNSQQELDMVLGADFFSIFNAASEFDQFVGAGGGEEFFFTNFYGGLIDELFIHDFALDPTTEATVLNLLPNTPGYDPNNPNLRTIAAEATDAPPSDGSVPEPTVSLLALLSMTALGARTLGRGRRRPATPRDN